MLPAVQVGAAMALARTALSLINHRMLPRLEPVASAPEPVTVCVPARNERDRLPHLIADLRAQRGVPRLRVLLLDDNSSDDTYSVATAAIAGDPRFTLHRSTADPPPGWLGKQAACAQLAESADAVGILMFLDADVRLAPDAIAAAAAALRAGDAALLTPWPLQHAESVAEHVVQPLLCWSWAATLPMRPANASLRASTAVACGQFLVFDAAAYRAIGHAAVARSLTEDLDLARTLRRAGHRTVTLPAGELASCRMYCGARELDAGYTRWLWQAYGGAPGSVAVSGALVLADLLPFAAAVAGRGRTRAWGLLGYASAVGSRLTARSMERGSLTGPDVAEAIAHPVSILAYLVLTVRSHIAHRRRRLGWKGRAITLDPAR
ncbi:MAG: glycosyltransferase [Aldersonia sp.]|nr:glycosyltransferase [Aldersonia sp.]